MSVGHEFEGEGGQTFPNLAPESFRRAMESKMRSMRAPKGRTIITAGARSMDVYYIVEGQLQVLLYSSTGREVSVRNLGVDDIFGELAALDGISRSATVVALTDVRLRIISRADFLSSIEASPTAAVWLARRLGSEVRRLTERVFELSALNVQARLHCELLRLARGGGANSIRVSPAPTHAELANRIGTHREAVTREMRVLAQMKIIRNDRRSLDFLNLAELERVVARAVGEMDDLRQVG